ncbi:hypothetical protein BC827DRAFT_1221608 [Russula dissimulans]|nr:hypothetical protein BC827DRAFT_1221608 [Russula dissimulans]
MENKPPFPAVRLTRPSSTMHPFPPSKSSPAKRDTTRILSPHFNHAQAPFQDVFNTGLLTPQASQTALDSDAAKSLISPPPEDSARAGTSRQSSQSSWTRAGSEPTSSLRYVANIGSSSKRKRPSFPSLTLHEIDVSSRLHRAAEEGHSFKPRKQTRRSRVESDVEDDAGSDGHSSPNVFPVARKQRQSHAPPPEIINPDHIRRSRTPTISPTKSPRSLALLGSPHAGNDRADFIPPVPSHTLHTPREVFVSSPRVSKSSKRKKTKTFKVTIKKEPPEIDLSCLPPPSPTDDPILLHGRPPRPRPPVPTNARETPLLESTPPGLGKQLSPINRCALDFPLPGIPSDIDDHEDSSFPEQPVFNFATNGEDSFTSSDGGDSEQEGEYTGKFRELHVPTKADPPTSATRERIEKWGRPISPFPHKADTIPETDRSDSNLPLVQPQFCVEKIGDCYVLEAPDNAQGSEIEVRQGHSNATEISEVALIASSSVPAHDNHVKAPSQIEAKLLNQEGGEEVQYGFGESPTYPQEDVEEDIEPGDENKGQDGNTPAQEQIETIAEFPPVDAQDEILISINPDSGDDELVGEEQTDEEIVDSALSEEPLLRALPLQVPARPQSLEECVELDEPMVEPADAESEGDSSDESDLSVVKIVSDDPWAAARAAAILKQNDWDLVIKAARKNRSSRSVESLIRKARRADLASAGVSKSSSPARSARRSFGVVVDGRVVMAGSPSMTLPELLHEAESDLDSPTFSRRPQSAFRTPSPAPSSFRRPEAPLVVDTDGPREWTRSDWKLLDACFTDARLEVGARWGSEGVLGDVDAVELEDVVRRFVDIFGEEVVATLGSAFEREDLLKRAKALQRKQRDGRGAPPTPTLRFSSVSSTPTVPDFTPVHPARRQGVSSTLPKLAAPAFQIQPTPRLPASLMAPRYSHLLEEAKSLSQSDSSGPGTLGELPAPLTHALDGELVTSSMSSTTLDQRVKEVPATPSMGNRVKGFIFSYLPTLKKRKTPRSRQTHEPARPGLPLPPPELLEKPRGPVITPQPRPAPRPAHPKELVNLQHASPPPSRVPMPPRMPKRLVDLRPVSPPPTALNAINIPEQRRTSSGSVKELVSSFEEMDQSREIEAHALELRRQKSARRLAAGGSATSRIDGRPAWR